MAFAVMWSTTFVPPTTYALSTLPLYSAEKETAGLLAFSTSKVTLPDLPASGPITPEILRKLVEGLR